MKSKIFILLVFVATAFCFVEGCGKNEQPNSNSSGNNPNKNVSQRTKVSVATSKNVWCALQLLAKQKGFFDEEGLDVEVNIQDAGKYCMDALVAKSVNVATVVEVNLAYLGFTGNRDVTIVASVVESESFAVVGKKSKGINKPQDLVGKSVAFSPGTGGELFAYHFLEHNGVKKDQVNIRKIQPAAIQGAIATGDVDAVATWEPFIYNCLKVLGDDGVALRDPAAYKGYLFLAARSEWVKENPLVVKSYLRALKKSLDFVQSQPTEAQAILAKETNLSPEIINSLWHYFTFQVSLDARNLAKATTAVARTITENQEGFQGKSIPSYAEYFDSSFLPTETKISH